MLITLGLILLILIMVVGGDRGVVSLIALCGNLLILSLAIGLWHQEFLFFSLRFVSALSFPVLRCSIKMVEMERHGVHFGNYDHNAVAVFVHIYRCMEK